MSYGSSLTVSAPFAPTVERVRSALAAQGFGILTEINMQGTMKAKLDRDMEDYVILGACNPPLANQALEADRSIGLLLPCNVVVRAAGPDTTIVEALDPQIMVQLTGKAELTAVADQAAEKLAAAMASLAG